MYSLADLTTMCGAKRRTVQLWAEAGAIKAAKATERKGSGVHREFTHDEAIVACVLAEFAEYGVPIGRLIGIGAAVRHFLDPAKKDRAKVEAAFNDSRPVFLSVHRGTLAKLLDNPTPDDCQKVFYGMSSRDPAAVIVFLNACLAKVRMFR